MIMVNGSEITIRPLERRDEQAVAAMHARCSLASRRMRYFSAKPGLPSRLFALFLDRSRALTLVAESSNGELVALAHLVLTSDAGTAELAFLVEDAWQNQGLGRHLTELMVDIGFARGLTELRASVFSDNSRMRRLLTSLGGRTSRSEDPAVVEMTITPLPVAVAA